MRRIARAHVGLVLAKAIYEDRETHANDLRLLRHGDERGPLTRAEKLAVVRRMLVRTGRSSVEAWMPASVLWALERLAARAFTRVRAKKKA